MSLKLTAPWGEINPDELENLGFKSTYGKRPSQALLSVDRITLLGKDFQEATYWRLAMNGYPGMLENVPVECESDSGVISQYFLRFRGAKWTTSSVSMDIVPRKGNLHFFERADNETFENIVAQGFLPKGLSVKVPYLVQRNDLPLQKLLLLTTGISITMELIQTVKDIADLIADALDVYGTGVLTTIAKAISLGIKFVALVIALINFINEIRKIYFPKLRNFRACSFLTLIKQGCLKLGYTLDSTLLNELANLHPLAIPSLTEITPSMFDLLPDLLPDETGKWYPGAGDLIPTLGSAIAQIETIYNAETVVYNGIVKIETKQWFQTNPIAIIPSVLNNQNEREDEWEYNMDDNVWNRKLLTYTPDYSDAHTVDKFYKIASEYSTQATSTINPDLVDITGFKNIDFGFSLGQRKNKLSPIEEAVRVLFKIVDNGIDLIAQNPNFESTVTNRVGALIISEENFSVTKLLWLNVDSTGQGKQPVNFIEYLATDRIYENYHLPYTVKNNAKKIVLAMEIPMTDYLFHQFSQNRYVTLGDNGPTIELMEATWLDRQHYATIDYAQPDNYADNTTTVQIY